MIMIRLFIITLPNNKQFIIVKTNSIRSNDSEIVSGRKIYICLFYVHLIITSREACLQPTNFKYQEKRLNQLDYRTKTLKN